MAEKFKISFEVLHSHQIVDHDVHDISELGPHLTENEETSRAGLTIAAMNHRILVARLFSEEPNRRSRIIGMVMLLTIDSAFTGRSAHIADLVVDPKFRGRHWGEGLSKILMLEAKELHAKRAWLRCNKKRKAAHKLYKKMGLTRLDDVFVFGGDL